jgi:3-phosphoglycerate kinase
MKLTVNEMSTLHRALGIVEGAADYMHQSAGTMLHTAIEMIDELLSKAEVETKMDGDGNG